MIPRSFITEWRAQAPWVLDAQVEQDLLISRALVELFSSPLLAANLGFRGGTALHKLFLKPATPYSEDLDFVQIQRGPKRHLVKAIREALDPFLGIPDRPFRLGRIVLIYSQESEIEPKQTMKIKVEINTREQFKVFDIQNLPFEVKSQWYSGEGGRSYFRA